MEYASLTNNQDDPQSNTVSEDFQPSSLTKITRTDADIDDSPPDPNSDVEDRNKSKAELAHPKKKYAKITNQKRLDLIDSVENKGQNIKQAAQTLKMNYSSAKSIFQVFKKEGRSIKKTYKQRFVRKNDNAANLEIPNPPCDNEELRKLLLPTETRNAQDVQQKQENIEQKSTPIGSYVGNNNKNQSFSDTTTPVNSLTPIQSVSGLSKSPLTSEASQTPVQQVFMLPPNFQNIQSPQMGQNQSMNMQQGMQTRYEMREMKTDNFNTMNTMTFVPQQQQQQQQHYMVYQGNMQPMQSFMIMNSPQPVYQNNNFQGFNTFQRVSQPPQQINEQNQKMFDFNEPAKIEMNNNQNQNQNQNQNIYIINNQNSNDPPPQRIQMNMYPSMTPANQMQYYMPTSTATYFVGGGGNNNNNNNNNNIQNNMYQQMQPMMFVQSQPNYYVQSFTATNDMYIPQQQQGGFMIYGNTQNQSQMQGNQGALYENKEDLMKAKKENL